MPSVILPVLAGLILGVGVLALVVTFRRQPQQAAGQLLAGGGGAAAVVARPSEPKDPSPILSHLLNRLGLSRRVQRSLLQAGLLVRPSELAALMIGLAATGFAVGLIAKGVLVGAALGVVGGSLPVMYVSYRIGRRRKQLVDQLADALAMMASSLRSGYSFMRAMQVVKEEMQPPISEEFGRVLDELNVGISQERALKHLLDRCPNPDVELVVTACQIQATVGGNLAEILDTTAEMIRERVRLQGEIAALTAEGRLSAAILTALPIVLAFVVNHLSPGYLLPLVETQMGMLMLGAGVGAMIMGVLIIKKMLSVRV